MTAEPRNPDYQQAVRDIFERANFIRRLGVRLLLVEPGRATTELELTESHLQQTGSAHAGVIATLADHTAGAAGTSLIAADQALLTAEFKINFLRPGAGRLRGEASVLKAGRSLVVAESEVWSQDDLCAKAIVSMVPIRR
jgi:uncharacterized protein (TIGR00369 family)